MRRPRPYIPWSVRRVVALRQLHAAERWYQIAAIMADSPMGDEAVTKHILGMLFGGAKHALDHNPALILREFNPRTGKYKPDANDPAHLIYRVVDDHHRKTNVSGDGALRSDTAERVHRRRLEKNRDARDAIRAGQPKQRRNKSGNKKLPRKAWPAGRKIESRGFR